MQLLTVQFARKTSLILPDSSSKACKLNTAKTFLNLKNLVLILLWQMVRNRLTLNDDYAEFGKQLHIVETLDKTY